MVRRSDVHGNPKKLVTKLTREIIKGLEINGSKVFFRVTDVGQGRAVGFFSNAVKGIKTYAYERVTNSAVQVYWKLAKR